MENTGRVTTVWGENRFSQHIETWVYYIAFTQISKGNSHLRGANPVGETFQNTTILFICCILSLSFSLIEDLQSLHQK